MTWVDKWIAFLVRPKIGGVWAALLAAGIVAALGHWHKVWLSTGVENWLSHQSGPARIVAFIGCWIGAYVVALLIVSRIIRPIQHAIDPAYRVKRAQRHRVKQLKTGDRVGIKGYTSPDHATVSKVSPAGEWFEVTRDADGSTKTIRYFNVDHFDLVK
jgi:hypothetical protein